MRAGRIRAPGSGTEPVDDPGLAPSGSGSAEPGADTVAGNREGQEDGRTFVFGDAVSARSQPIDDKLDEIAHLSRAPHPGTYRPLS